VAALVETAPIERMLDIRDIQKLLGISPRTSDRYLIQGIIPPPDFKPNRRIRRWRPETIRRLMEKGVG
jgi:hypothetical protein